MAQSNFGLFNCIPVDGNTHDATMNNCDSTFSSKYELKLVKLLLSKCSLTNHFSSLHDHLQDCKSCSVLDKLHYRTTTFKIPSHVWFFTMFVTVYIFLGPKIVVALFGSNRFSIVRKLTSNTINSYSCFLLTHSTPSLVNYQQIISFITIQQRCTHNLHFCPFRKQTISF